MHAAVAGLGTAACGGFRERLAEDTAARPVDGLVLTLLVGERGSRRGHVRKQLIHGLIRLGLRDS